MSIRLLAQDDLPALLRLYCVLQPGDPPLDPSDPRVAAHWYAMLKLPMLTHWGYFEDDTLASTCNLTLIPNLTRSMRPYGIIENVVTAPEFRRRGLATTLLRSTLTYAWEKGCYKVMLQTGSKQESTLRLYERAGFLRGAKTGFVAYPDPGAP